MEQLGKRVIKFDLKFDVGYLTGAQRVCFSEKDDIREELTGLMKKGKSLWCDGMRKVVDDDDDATIVVNNSDSEEEFQRQPTKKRKVSNALESKTLRVDALANELKELHKDKYTKIQYKLWAEALDVKRHTSKEHPPWSDSKKQKGQAKNSVWHSLRWQIRLFLEISQKVLILLMIRLLRILYLLESHQEEESNSKINFLDRLSSFTICSKKAHYFPTVRKT